MSFVELNGDSIIRHFSDGDSLPAPWEDPKKIKEADLAIFDSDGNKLMTIREPGSEVRHLGGAMLGNTAEVIPFRKVA